MDDGRFTPRQIWREMAEQHYPKSLKYCCNMALLRMADNSVAGWSLYNENSATKWIGFKVAICRFLVSLKKSIWIQRFYRDTALSRLCPSVPNLNVVLKPLRWSQFSLGRRKPAAEGEGVGQSPQILDLAYPLLPPRGDFFPVDVEFFMSSRRVSHRIINFYIEQYVGDWSLDGFDHWNSFFPNRSLSRHLRSIQNFEWRQHWPCARYTAR